MPQIVRRSQAVADVIECAGFVGAEHVEVGLRFVAAAEAAFERLATFPYLGAQLTPHRPAFGHFRRWPIRGFENYLVVYRPIADGIEVIRVLHGARDIEALFEASE